MNFYHDLTMSEVNSALKNNKLFVPIGTIEQHGPHLPLSVDVDIPTAIAIKLAHELTGIVAPAITYGARSLPQSGGGPSFPGTIAIKAETLIGYYRDIFQSYINHGATELILINGHYENEPFMFEALEQCREANTLNAKVIALSWWSVITQDLIVELFGDLFPGWHAEHAGLVETSLMMYLHPQKVRELRLDHDAPPLGGIYLHPIDPAAISNQGILAKTKGSSAAIGKILFNHICDKLLIIIKKPHGMLHK